MVTEEAQGCKPAVQKTRLLAAPGAMSLGHYGGQSANPRNNPQRAILGDRWKARAYKKAKKHDICAFLKKGNNVRP
jgi:hypothetical protein